MDIIELSTYNQQAAWKIIEETRVIQIWENIGAKVCLVGSLKSGLLMKNKDIDFHVYTDELNISDSFSAIKELALNPGIKDIQYRNLIDTEEECIEWHVRYKGEDGYLWKMDIIHIRKGSAYDGYIEKVTEGIMAALTPEIKRTILEIKYEVPETDKTLETEQIMGLEVYRAVLEGKVRNYSEFMEWRRLHPFTGVMEWMP